MYKLLLLLLIHMVFYYSLRPALRCLASPLVVVIYRERKSEFEDNYSYLYVLCVPLVLCDILVLSAILVLHCCLVGLLERYKRILAESLKCRIEQEITFMTD